MFLASAAQASSAGAKSLALREQISLFVEPATAADPEEEAADPSRDPAVLAGYRERFSLAAAGARYRARLEEQWGQRQELAGRLKWRADTPV